MLAHSFDMYVVHVEISYNGDGGFTILEYAPDRVASTESDVPAEKMGSSMADVLRAKSWACPTILLQGALNFWSVHSSNLLLGLPFLISLVDSSNLCTVF